MCELRHAHIAELQHVFECEGPAQQRVAYVQLRLYDGGDLAKWLRRVQPNAVQRHRLLRHVALALQHIPAHGMAHGDVKLQNVLINAEVRPPDHSTASRNQCTPLSCARRLRRALWRCLPTSRRRAPRRRRR